MKIGSQVWMAENLNYKAYSGSWCYDNEEENCDIYGRLYKWDIAKTACPVGWHLPTDNEWKILEMYLGMSQSEADEGNYRGTDEGEKLKSTTGWDSDGNGNDKVGFSALPGGWRFINGDFISLGVTGIWWSATENYSSAMWDRGLYYMFDEIIRNIHSKDEGHSVRCVRD